jgi:hypothetical protein
MSEHRDRAHRRANQHDSIGRPARQLGCGLDVEMLEVAECAQSLGLAMAACGVRQHLMPVGRQRLGDSGHRRTVLRGTEPVDHHDRRPAVRHRVPTSNRETHAISRRRPFLIGHVDAVTLPGAD